MWTFTITTVGTGGGRYICISHIQSIKSLLPPNLADNRFHFNGRYDIWYGFCRLLLKIYVQIKLIFHTHKYLKIPSSDTTEPNEPKAWVVAFQVHPPSKKKIEMSPHIGYVNNTRLFIYSVWNRRHNHTIYGGQNRYLFWQINPSNMNIVIY